MYKIITLVLIVFLVTGCASTKPDWSGMGQDEIASWQALSMDAGSAQMLKKAGISVEDANLWVTSGIRSAEQILQWLGADFDVQSASDWNNGGFNVLVASQWRDEKFTAQDALEWVQGGFDLETAIDHRKKGLQPIQK